MTQACCELPLRKDTPYCVNNIERDRVPHKYAAAIGACCSGDKPWPLTLAGDVGVGKTYAAKLLWSRGIGRSWYSSFTFLVRSHAEAKRHELIWYDRADQVCVGVDEFWRHLADTNRLVVVDDIGVRGDESPHAYETLLELLDRRIGKPTVFTTNHKLSGLQDIYDLRIADRLRAGTYVYLEGDSQRGDS